MLCRGLKFLSVSSFHRKANIRVTIELRTATNPAHKRVRGNGGSLKRQTSRCDTFLPPLKKIFRPRLLTVSINIDILFHSSLFFWMGSGKHQQSFAFFSVILVLCCLSMNLWIYLTGKWHSVSPPSHLGSLIKINRWFRPIFSLHAPHIGWRFSKVCHFFQLVLLFVLRPAPHVCNEFSVLSHDLFLLLCLLFFFCHFAVWKSSRVCWWTLLPFLRSSLTCWISAIPSKLQKIQGFLCTRKKFHCLPRDEIPLEILKFMSFLQVLEDQKFAFYA